MWDDVIIGTGHRGNSAIKVCTIGDDHNISENSTSYWISDAYLGIGMTIFKDTEAGKFLTAYIKCGASVGEIKGWVERLAITEISPERMKVRVKEALDLAFQTGRAHRAAEIRNALGIQ